VSPWGLVFCLGLFLFSEKAQGGVEREEGKSLKISVEGNDRAEALKVARASVAAVDLFDELTSSRLQPQLKLQGKLVDGTGGVRGDQGLIEGDSKSEDFAAAWVVQVIEARIRGVAERRDGAGSIRWVAEGCVGRATLEDEEMLGRVATRVSVGEEAGLSRIQSWGESGRLAEDKLTRMVRRLLAARLFTRATSAEHRVRFQEWVAVGCPGKFWSDSKEEDGAWRRSLAEPDLRTGALPQSPDETQRRLRKLAQEAAKSVVPGGTKVDSLSTELVRLEATADPFLRPAIFRYRQAVEAGSSEVQEKAWQDADQAVQRWREMRMRADQLLDWYELNVPDARWGPALLDGEEKRKL